MDTTPNKHPEQHIELPKNIAPSLPMNPDWVRWPSCFSSIRISEDGMSREVMLNDAAWSEAGKVWKFYPSHDAQIVERQAQELRSREPFQWNENLCDDLDVLWNFVTQMWSIDDQFPDHTQRREFYEQHPEVSLYCGKISKLRKNTISYVYYAFNTIKSKIPELAGSLLNNIPQDLRKYDELSFEDKKNYIQRIDKAILDFFQSILDLSKQ